EYRLPQVRGIPDPRVRLDTYCNPRLIAAWEPVRGRWLTRGIRVKPDFGTTATLQIEGLDGPEAPRAVARFTDRSVIELGSQRHSNGREWVMTAWLRPDLSRIEDATFRPASVEEQVGEHRR